MKNIKEQATEAIKVLQAILDENPRVEGRIIKGCEKFTEVRYDIISLSLEEFLNNYRLKNIEFPKLPEGQAWYNPKKLTADFFNPTAEGWRPCLNSERERPPKDTQIYIYGQGWTNRSPDFVGSGVNGESQYRTKAPLPEVVVEMTVADVEKLVGKKVKIIK